MDKEGAMKAVELASAFIQLYGNSSYLTNMKINKLVYFAYAHSIQRGDKLFDDKIEAWKYGAVIPSIYHVLKAHKNMGITTTNIATSDKALREAKATWALYGYMTASDIMNFCHRDGGAWKAVYNGTDHATINDSDILASTDGKELPVKEQTSGYAMDKLIEKRIGLLRMLENA